MAESLNIGPFDPNNLSNPMLRILAGPVRMGAVTPGTPYGETATWLYVGTTGNISIKTVNNTDVTINAVPVGWMRISSTMVNTAGTTATNLLWGS